MKISRRSFVTTLFAASQASLLGIKSIQGQTPPPDALRFLVIGDWGRRGRPDQQQVADQMAHLAESFRPQFIVSVGDNFYDDGVASIDDSHWQQSYERVYSAASLQVPWYITLGNHDYVGNTDAQLAYAKTSQLWTLPSRYYAVSRKVGDQAVDLFFTDTCPAIKAYHDPIHVEHPALHEHVLQQDWGAQLTWLEQALAQSIAPWKLVFGHHPIYSGGIHGDQQELIEQFLPLFQKHGVQAYFCGHDHDLQHLAADQVQLFVSGGGSEHRVNHMTPHAVFSESISGFMSVFLDKSSMAVQVIDNNGTVLYSASVPIKPTV